MKKTTLFRHPLFAVLILLNSCIHSPSKTEVTETTAETETTEAIATTNGDLNNSFIEEAPQIEMSQEQVLAQEKERLLSEGWEEKEIANGQLSTCYNFAPKKGNTDNYLKVQVGGGTDVSIKIMNVNTNKCVRYVFINSRTTYSIKNIPEGEYYLKIAYGKNWVSKVKNGQCVGKFISNPLYEKGEDILNYNLQYTDDGYNIPSYTLSLDVISTGTSNSFNSQNISESEFNQ
jgi:hypothetical protein